MDPPHMIPVVMTEQNSITARLPAVHSLHTQRLRPQGTGLRGKIRTEIQDDPGGGCAHFCDTAADLPCPPLNDNFHKKPLSHPRMPKSALVLTLSLHI